MKPSENNEMQKSLTRIKQRSVFLLNLLKFLLIFMLLAVIINASFAQSTATWTGVDDNSWANSNNWDIGTVPDNSKDVIIPAGCPNWPLIDKKLIIGTAFISGDAYRCKSIDIQTNGRINSQDSLWVNGTFNISGLYFHNDLALSGTHQVNSGGSITVNSGGSMFIGDYGDIPNSKQDLVINSGGSYSNAGYCNINDCLIVKSGGSFNMSGTWAYLSIMGWEASYNATYPATFYVEAGASGGVTGGELKVQGNEQSGYYTIHILEPTFDFTGTSQLTMYNESDQSPPLGNQSMYFVDGVDIYDLKISNLGNVTTIESNLTISNDFTVENPSCVTIASGNTVTVGNDFLLKSDLLNGNDFYSSFIDYGTLSVSGTSKVEWAIEGDRWHFVSSPVSGETAAVFDGMYLQEFSETTNIWTDITSATHPLDVMVGYSAWFTDPWWQTIYFTGPVNTGNIGTDNNLTKNNQGWNVVANPYPSAINWDTAVGWTKTNLNNAIYTENNGQWASYVNGVGTNGGTRFIAPCHGFFVEANAHPATLKMTNDIRQHKKPIHLKSYPNNVIRLEAMSINKDGGTKKDETVIRFNSNASFGFDGEYDARKFFGSDTLIPQLYSSPYYLSVNTIPSIEPVDINLKVRVKGDYIIRAVSNSGMDNLILKDQVTGIATNLVNGSYSFYAEPGDNHQRFKLYFSPLSVSENGINENISIYLSNGQIIIDASVGRNFSDNSEIQVYAYDLLGRTLAFKKVKKRARSVLNIDHTGFCIVKVIFGGNTYTQKLFLN